MTVTGPDDQRRIGELADRQLATQWRPPRPRDMPALRSEVTRALTEPVAVSALNAYFPRLTGVPTPIGDDVDTWRNTMDQATMWHVDAYISMLVAQVAHVTELAPHLELTEKTVALQPEAPPAQYGFMLYTLPVAWTPGEVVAVSWVPAGGGEHVDGGVDLTAWAPTTPEVVTSLVKGAAADDGPRLMALARGMCGPLVPVAKASWGYLQPAAQHKDAVWLIAVHATWLAMRTAEVKATAVRRWWRRATGPGGRLVRLRWRSGATPGAVSHPRQL